MDKPCVKEGSTTMLALLKVQPEQSVILLNHSTTAPPKNYISWKLIPSPDQSVIRPTA